MDQLADMLVDSKPIIYRTGAHRPAWAVVCFVPKAGSTAWRALLARGLALQGFTKMDLLRSPHEQGLPYNVSQAAVSALSSDSPVPKLMFVRHPVSRLLSAYLGKGVTGRLPVPGWNHSTGFRSFVHAVTSAKSADLDPHYRLQTAQCGLPSLEYRYLRAEDIGHWYREVICSLGLQQAASSRLHLEAWTAPCSSPPCCFVRTTDCGCELQCSGVRCNASRVGTHAEASFGSFNAASDAANLEQHYDHSLAQLVNAWAHADLRDFGYMPWLPGQTIAHRLHHHPMHHPGHAHGHAHGT